MPNAIPNGGGEDISTSDLQAYNAVINTPAGTQTAIDESISVDIEEKAEALAAGWTDSGGPGGFQRDVAAEVVIRAATLQGQVQASVRQWASRANTERGQMEIIGSLMQALIERDRLLLELRERLNASPY
jgi:hypothetical protein